MILLMIGLIVIVMGAHLAVDHDYSPGWYGLLMGGILFAIAGVVQIIKP